MTNLCVSDPREALFSKQDRYEVSVQAIMGCNAQRRGCEGGWAYSADNAMSNHGIAKERDAEYLCGSGNALNHFDEKSGDCDTAPWGRECAPMSAMKNNMWVWDGAYVVSGHERIMGVVATG